MRKPLAFEEYHAYIETELQASLGPGNLSLYSMLRYHLGSVDAQGRPSEHHGGKFLRPTLCLSACKAVGGEPERAVPAAVAVELTHNFSLIHDDIQDISEYRRHRPTVWKVWGVPQAINAGDSIYALAYLEVLRLLNRGVPEKRVLSAVQILGQACRLICEGQYLDISFESRHSVTVDEYMQMISGKTGALMEASTHLGALVGTVDDKLVECLAGFGRHLGTAFQIQDDILGIWGGVEETGKSQYDDILRRKKTLPVIFGLAHPEGMAGEELSALYRRPDMSLADAARVASLLEGSGARDHARRVVEQHRQLAMRELGSAPVSEGVTELMGILDFVLGQSVLNEDGSRP